MKIKHPKYIYAWRFTADNNNRWNTKIPCILLPPPVPPQSTHRGP